MPAEQPTTSSADFKRYRTVYAIEVIAVSIPTALLILDSVLADVGES
jgi:S-adenosylmethionine:tRNA-ribosyltransferase-isomerase (queuine synthetase)